MDFIGRSPGEKFLPDEREFVALKILKGKLLANGEHFTIHEVGILARLIFDVEVISPGEKLLFHDIAHKIGFGFLATFSRKAQSVPITKRGKNSKALEY